MLRSVLGLAGLLALTGCVFAARLVTADGRVCYNDECAGVYDTPPVQCMLPGHAGVPRIKGMAYSRARAALINYGWKPQESAEELGANEEWAVDAGLLRSRGLRGYRLCRLPVHGSPAQGKGGIVGTLPLFCSPFI
jgi:hypothetical protein